jgi:formylglycine-generating enzyme required for sulfatase activity
MGSPTNDQEGPQTAVTISRGFWMGKYEVTQGEYLAVMGSNPSWFNGDRTADGSSNYGTDLSRPVETVSWDGATNYCSQLTQRERAAGRIATNRYRLPRRRSGRCVPGVDSTRQLWDDASYTNLTKYAWYSDNSKVDGYDSYSYNGLMPHPVGQKLANPWGLCDMHGNVWEWCQDWFSPYPGVIVLDPQGPATGSRRVFRGGDWHDGAKNCRSAARDDTVSYPWSGGRVIGFRVVLAPGQP